MAAARAFAARRVRDPADEANALAPPGTDAPPAGPVLLRCEVPNIEYDLPEPVCP
jgi:hypothetical protein